MAHNSPTPAALVKKVLTSDEGTLVFLFSINSVRGVPAVRVRSFPKKNKKLARVAQPPGGCQRFQAL